jgi:hypothetical protein
MTQLDKRNCQKVKISSSDTLAHSKELQSKLATIFEPPYLLSVRFIGRSIPVEQ